MRTSSLKEDFWALKNVTFEIKKGEVLGIVGPNGAGKSTLLKILSRITEPSEGLVHLKGRVASLLEVGTGFHPELTGRENISLNGAILGMKRAEIKRKFDEIVAFAQIEKFLDTPVKHYSSGMYVRLAFAVASHLEPEILVVDEILAVGDFDFQKKCLGKMEAVAKNQGRTVIFVSHNMSAVRNLCSRCILLRNGRVADDGATRDVLESYLGAANAAGQSNWERPSGGPPTSPLFFKSIWAQVTGEQPSLVLRVQAEIVCLEERFPRTFVSIDLCDTSGTPLLQAIPFGDPFLELTKGLHLINIDVDLPGLVPGRYAIDLWVGTHYTATVDYVKNAAAITVEESPVPNRTYPHFADHGFLVSRSRCEYKQIDIDKGGTDWPPTTDAGRPAKTELAHGS
jgi:lipopolysaccharide transport system ATP-binding protein